MRVLGKKKLYKLLNLLRNPDPNVYMLNMIMFNVLMHNRELLIKIRLKSKNHSFVGIRHGPMF